MGNIFFIWYDKAKTLSLLRDFTVEIYVDDSLWSTNLEFVDGLWGRVILEVFFAFFVCPSKNGIPFKIIICSKFNSDQSQA
jgi:hypothetical protein